MLISLGIDPDIYLATINDLEILGDDVSGFSLLNNGDYTSRIGAYSDIVAANIVAGGIDTQLLTIKGMNVEEMLFENSNQVAQIIADVEELQSGLNSEYLAIGVTPPMYDNAKPIDTYTGAYLSGVSISTDNVSQETIVAVDPEQPLDLTDILNKISTLPIEEWSYFEDEQ